MTAPPASAYPLYDPSFEHDACGVGFVASIDGKKSHEMIRKGIDVLLDDRPERPGVKFADADLIGIPWRVTVSARSLKSGGVELKKRSEAEREVKPLDGFVNWLAEQICSEQKRLVVTG